MNPENEEVKKVFRIIHPEHFDIKSYSDLADSAANSFTIERFDSRGQNYVDTIIESAKKSRIIMHGTGREKRLLYLSLQKGARGNLDEKKKK